MVRKVTFKRSSMVSFDFVHPESFRLSITLATVVLTDTVGNSELETNTLC